MSARNFGKDRKGLAIGPDSLLRVNGPTGRWKGWVVSYDEERDLLTLRDFKRAFERYAKPEHCTVTRPSDMDQARRQGQDRSMDYMSKVLNQKRKLKKETP